MECKYGWRHQSFNPTLVRLRHVLLHGIEIENKKFQSHAGSIEGTIEGNFGKYVWAVSIPRWFD